MSVSLNVRAAGLVDELLADAEALGVAVTMTPSGVRIVDCGIAAPGGLEAGRRFARIAMGGLGEIAFTPLVLDGCWLPGLTVTTGLVGRVPVGVQVVSGRFREDLCLAAGEAIEAGGTPSSPVDPAS